MAIAAFANAIRTRPQRPSRSAGEHLAAFFRLLRINVRRNFGLLVVLATASFAIFFVSRTAVTEVVLWRDWSYYVGRTFVIVGPIFAIWSAYPVQRDAKANRAELLETTASSRIWRELGSAAVGVLGALICYGIVAGTVLGFAATRATWGGPDAGIVLFGAAMTTLFALVGWLMGIAFPSRLTPVIAGLATLFYTTISYTWGPATSDLSALQPYRYVADSGWGSMQLFNSMPEYPGAPHPDGGALLAVGAAALLIAGYLLWRRSMLALVALVVAGVMLVPGWGIATDIERVEWTPVHNPPISCGGDIVQLCLHQAYEAQLDEGVAMIDAVLAPVVGIADLPDKLTQRPYSRTASPPGVRSLNRYWTGTSIEWVLARPLGQAMFNNVPSETPTSSQSAILVWLFDQAGYTWPGSPPFSDDYYANLSAAADRFAALSPGEQRAWLEANWDALRAGELTLEDLP